MMPWWVALIVVAAACCMVLAIERARRTWRRFEAIERVARSLHRAAGPLRGWDDLTAAQRGRYREMAAEALSGL